MGPGDLQLVLGSLPLRYHPKVIVGLEKPDDAGVYQIDDRLALVQTVDLITPVVNDPVSFGRIAAANALSDVYAMGAQPVMAMNIACFPTETMDKSVLTQMLIGAIEKMDEAGVALIGGHTVRDEELKFGLAVTGVVAPDKVVLQSTAREGDSLVLTKPLGVGILATALKAGMLSRDQQDRLIIQMEQLNKEASEVMVSVGVNACTDVTGFGLIGHAMELASSSGVGVELFSGQVPILPGTAEFADMGLIAAGLHANREFYEKHTEGLDKLPLWLGDALFDPQTSGGLLISVAPEKLDYLVDGLKGHNIEAAVIGKVISGTPGQVVVK